MKITPKFQRGGGFDQFFTTYTPVEIQSQQGRSSQQSSRQTDRSEESTKGRLTEKDFFEMIKDIDGLPNEMNALVTNLMNTFQLDRMSGQSTGDLATKYLSNLYQIKTLAQNKKKYDEAVATAQKNGAMAEPAISMDGKLIVQNKENGSLNAISIDKYYKNRDDYAIITVSNLANMRAYSPSLARSQEAIDIINNSMGYEAFQELLSKSTQSLGSSENSRNGFFSVEGQASKGLELLQKLSNDDRVQALGSITAQGLYEYKIIDKSQLNQINALTSYITTLLPDRAKTWAAIKTGQSDKNQATKDLVFTYLLGRSNNTHTFNINYEGPTTKSSTDKSEVTGEIANNTAMKWLRGLGVQNIFTINPGTNYATQVLANTLPLTDSSKKYLGSNSVLQQATQGEYAGILNFNSASMGMQKIDQSNFGKIVLTDGKISSIDFPSIVLDDGTVVPDLSQKTSQAKQAADRDIKQLGVDLSDIDSISANYKAINDIYVKYGLEPAYNPDGTPTNNWTRFGVINASASNNALGMDQFDNNELLQTIDDDEIVDNLLQITKEENYDQNNFLWNGVDHFYRGTVWIPVDVSYIAASANSSMKTDQLNNIIIKEAELKASRMITKEKK